MPRSAKEIVELLSQRSSMLLLTQFQDTPSLAEGVLRRVADSVEEWEEGGVLLDPLAFEVVTDVLVKQFAASHLAAFRIVQNCTCRSQGEG